MSQTPQQEQEILETLLSPISADHPEGEDLSYSELFQKINEARRADDPALAQGDWAAPLKVADWSKVRQLCEEGLCDDSKDLQLAAWYTEAITHLEGFPGAASGLRLIGELMRRFRETLYPNDPDERIGKFTWLSTQLGITLRQVPLTMPQHGGYDWFRWEETRTIANLQRLGGNAYDKAIKDGKLPVGSFEKSARESGADWYRILLEDLVETGVALEELDSVTEECFGEEAPSFAEIREALSACQDVARRLYELCGGLPNQLATNVQPGLDSPSDEQASTVPLSGSTASAMGPVKSRADAIHQLREIAQYFRMHEPHNPVALLAERAAKWAEMPLEHWLKTVIKDAPTLAQLRELLDFRPD